MRYIGRKYGLYADNDRDLAKQDMIEQQIRDFQMSFLKLLINPDYENLKDAYINEKLPEQLLSFDRYLAQKEWFAGKLTYVDFLAYETFDWIRLFSPTSLEKFDNLNRFMTRFKSLPPIHKYINSDEFKDWPLFGPMFKFGFWK